MKSWKIMLTIFVLSVLTVSSVSCASQSDLTPQGQEVTVQRGNLSVDITGVGNLALSQKVDLAFEMPGTVAEVLVEEGDSVEKGQVLAKLDTSEWEEQITQLENKVITAEGNVTTKERAVTAAERQVTQAGRQITVKELDLIQAQINLQTAEDDVNKVAEIAEAKDVREAAEWDLRIAQARQKETLLWADNTVFRYWNNEVVLAQARLTKAEQELKEILAGSSVKITADVAIELTKKKLQVELAKGRLADAEIAVEDAKKTVEDAKNGIEDAKKALEDAQKALADAQEGLDEAMNASSEVSAPFTGFITKVNIKGGDAVKKGTVAVVIADPSKFEADILVNEMDIFQVKLEGNASVQVDAMPGLSLPAEVTRISPTATIQQGVVNYKVKVKIQSLETVMPERQQASGNLSSVNITSGAPFLRFGQSFATGNLTQEQIEQMMKRRQQAQAGQTGGQQQQMPTIVPENLQLREGLTVIVSLIIQEKNDVLLVPNAAITTQRGQAYVQMLTPGGTIEERAIQTGISDGQYTEVVNGLSEGEKVIRLQATATTSTGQRQPQGGMFIPGMGGIR